MTTTFPPTDTGWAEEAATHPEKQQTKSRNNAATSKPKTTDAAKTFLFGLNNSVSFLAI